MIADVLVMVAMRTRPLICVALAGAAWLCPPPTMAWSKDDGVTALSGIDVLAKRATPLSGVTVLMKACPEGRKSPDPDTPAPKLVSTFPENRGKVRPGVLVLRLTFDRPMICMGLLDAEGYRPNPCPAPLVEPMISHDRRTFLTVCMIAANNRYGLRLRRFASLAGAAAAPSDLEFETSLGRPVRTVEQALAEDPWMKDGATP